MATPKPALAPQHGCPTPPHSPDVDDDPSAAGASPSLAHFDPLEGYSHPQSHSTTSTIAAHMDTAAAPRPGLPTTTTTNASSSGAARPSATSSTTAHPLGSSAGTRRRSNQGAGHGVDASEGGWAAEDEQDPPRRAPSSSTTPGRRNSAGASTGGRAFTDKERRKAKTAPPRDPELFDTDDEWQEHHEQEQTSGWHHLPLVLVALPPLGAIVHGRAENWSDAIILLLICFYLYQLIKVPWELYYASHSRTVLPSPSSPLSTSGAPASPSLVSATLTPDDPLSSQRLHSAAALRRNELFSLLLTLAVPFLGASLLHYAKGLLSDPERYINRMTVGLFVVASGVRPWMRFFHLIKRNSLYHQSLVHYPSSEVYQLRRRVEKLEADLTSLTAAFATKSDIRLLRTAINSPMTDLTRAVRRQSKSEASARLSTEERFGALAAQVEEMERREEAREREVEGLRRRVERRERGGVEGVGRVLLGLTRHVLLHLASSTSEYSPTHLAIADGKPSSVTLPHSQAGSKGWYESGLAWYLFWPVNVPRAVVAWTVDRAIEVVGLPEAYELGGSGGGGGKGRALEGGMGKGRRGIEASPSPGGKGERRV
ncbi:hypothetical protein JCM8097_001740 [Rhodosporidiobolus ruineniae]